MSQTIFSSKASHFYPQDRDVLKKLLQSMLQKKMNSLKTGQKTRAILVPHAAFQYSGQCAAYAYQKVMKEDFEHIIILANSHQHSFKNKILCPQADFYESPLGRMKIATGLKKKLLALSALAEESDEAFAEEHAIDNQIPFLNFLFPQAQILPLLLDEIQDSILEHLSQFFGSLPLGQTLFIASSDFTPNLKNAEAILQVKAQAFQKYMLSTHDTICGASAISLLLKILENNHAGELLHSCQSSDLHGDKNHNVSYLSFAFYENAPNSLLLSEQEKLKLLELCRQNLEYYFEHQKPLPLSSLPSLPPQYQEKQAVFVTLKKAAELRGCMGEVESSASLVENILKMSLEAALHDPRFPALKKSELAQIKFEISILTKLQAIHRLQEIDLNRHGIVLKKDKHSALFLPQVAQEEKWDLESTLMHLSLKAGLGPDAWRGCSVFCF